VGFEAETQGQELMSLLMLLAHPSDGVHAAAEVKGNLLAAVNHAHHLDVAVSSAVTEVGLGCCGVLRHQLAQGQLYLGSTFTPLACCSLLLPVLHTR
jgi:hypothetical protein